MCKNNNSVTSVPKAVQDNMSFLSYLKLSKNTTSGLSVYLKLSKNTTSYLKLSPWLPGRNIRRFLAPLKTTITSPTVVNNYNYLSITN